VVFLLNNHFPVISPTLLLQLFEDYSTMSTTIISTSIAPTSSTLAIETPEKTYILSHEKYLTVRAAWKSHSKTSTATAWHHLAYLLLMNKKIEKSFRPVRSARRLASLEHQGRGPSYKLREAGAILSSRIASLLRYGKKLENGDLAFALSSSCIFLLSVQELEAMQISLIVVLKSI